jgi:hypothetical protein
MNSKGLGSGGDLIEALYRLWLEEVSKDDTRYKYKHNRQSTKYLPSVLCFPAYRERHETRNWNEHKTKFTFKEYHYWEQKQQLIYCTYNTYYSYRIFFRKTNKMPIYIMRSGPGYRCHLTNKHRM